MPFDIGNLAQGAANDVIGGGLGLLLGGINDQRQLNQNQALLNQQVQAGEQLSSYNFGQQYQLWQETNYPAQVKQLEMAGLNPGLLYGKGGGGGATTGSPTGAPSGSSAQQNPGEVQQMMGLQLQNSMLQAQIENIKSQTNKNNVEANKEGGVDTDLVKSQTQLNIQGVTNQQDQDELLKIQRQSDKTKLDILNSTADAQKGYINDLYQQAEQQVIILSNQASVAASTRQLQIAQVCANLANSWMDTVLKQANANLSDQQSKIPDSQIQYWKDQIGIGKTGNQIQAVRNGIEQFKADLQNKYPSLMSVLGGAVQGLSEQIGHLAGDKPKTTDQK